MPIDGIPVDTQETEELCAQCRKNLQLKIYLNLQSKERIFAIMCPHCKTEPVEINRFKQNQNSTQLKKFLPKKQTFITGNPSKKSKKRLP